jgi:hypothetical protein
MHINKKQRACLGDMTRVQQLSCEYSYFYMNIGHLSFTRDRVHKLYHAHVHTSTGIPAQAYQHIQQVRIVPKFWAHAYGSTHSDT